MANGKLIVTDSTNNRVLIWDSIPTADNATADYVLGQPDFISDTANNNPSAAPGTPSAQTLSNPTGVWSDGNRLVVVDSGNNRVLIWDNFPSSQADPANHVLGQQGFGSGTANDFSGTGTPGSPTADSLDYPYAVFSKNGQLFVADYGNNRVLVWNDYFNTPHNTADAVLGQSSFTTNSVNAGSLTPSATSLWNPSGLYVAGTQLIVADNGNNRYLIYNSQP